MGNNRLLGILAVLVVTAPSFLIAQKGTTWTDPSPHKSGYVIANGVRLNYLDWGGSGPVLILIHGMDDNPHIFDDLAPSFTNRFRVIAYAQRGHGNSEAKEPYDAATLAEDLRGLMDGLGIAKANLAGWSMAGNVITFMAGQHPERVERIVYLDGGYDWADPTFAPAFEAFPIDLSPPASAVGSLEAFRRYENSIWFPGLSDMSRVEAYIRNLITIQPDGSVKRRMNDATEQSVLQALMTDRRDYSKVHSPALAIYAETFLDLRHGEPAQLAKNSVWEQKYMVPFRIASKEKIQTELSGTEVVSVPGTHVDFVFVSREQIVTAMTRFLGESATPALAHNKPTDSKSIATADEKQQVLDLGKEWVASEVKHDATTLRRILDNKFVASFGTEKPYDKEAFIKLIVTGDVDPTESQTLTDETVVIDQDTAIEVGTDTVHGTEKGAAYTVVYRYTVTYIRRHGEWLALAEHLVQVPPAK